MMRVRKKRSPVQIIKKILDDLWSLCIRRRDKCCIVCGKTETLQAHHWYKRKARSLNLRWDIRNGVTLCWYCHMKQVHEFSDHEFMQKFFAICHRMFPVEVRNAMDLLADADADWTMEDFLKKKQELEAYLSQPQPHRPHELFPEVLGV